MRQANIEEWSKILVYIECRKGKIHPVGRELIAEASRLAKRLDMPVYAAAIGSDLEKIEGQLSGCPLERLSIARLHMRRSWRIVSRRLSLPSS